MAARGLAVHAGILLVACGFAFRTWTKVEDTAPKHGESPLWAIRSDQVEEVRFESKVGVIRLEPRNDSTGKYFIGTVKKNPEPPDAKKDAPPADSAGMTPPEPPPPAEAKTSQFIATKDGDDLVNSIAPLLALRVLGKVSDAQKADFGLDQEEGKLFVRAGGTEHAITFGGPTPGGTDRYAKDPSTGLAYVISGAILRDLTSADQRLIEHKLHGYDDATAKRVKVTVGEASKEYVRSAEKKDAWTKPSEPAGKDETVSNWLGKVERLRVTSYEGEKLAPPPAPADTVVRLEYYDDRKSIGFVEIIRRPGSAPDKQEYVARTELTRWYASVVRSSAEQIDQDVKSVVGQ